MSIQVTGVDFVTMPTHNLEAAKEFYGTVLGLEQSNVYQRGEGPPMGLEYETGSLTLSVLDVGKLSLDMKSNGGPVALHVDDVEAARKELESKGVKFAADTMDSGVCHMAFFADPDGNALMIHNRYAAKS